MLLLLRDVVVQIVYIEIMRHDLNNNGIKITFTIGNY